MDGVNSLPHLREIFATGFSADWIAYTFHVLIVLQAATSPNACKIQNFELFTNV